MSDLSHDSVSRRDFLRATTCGAAAAGLGAMTSPAHAESPASRPATTFKKPPLPCGKMGRTGYPVTLISFGAIRISERLGTRILRAAVDAGVNLVHTSTVYAGGKSILAVADFLKADKSYRDKVFLCVKSFKPETEKEIDEMLKTLGTDHFDATLTTFEEATTQRLEAIQKMQDALIKKGKVRHTGFVCHKDMNEVMELVLDKAPKYFDMALIAMVMLAVPGNPEIKKFTEAQSKQFAANLKAFRQNGIGILSMKSGGKVAVTEGTAVFQPHAKAILEAGVDSVLTSFNTFDQIDMLKKLDLKSSHMTADERKAAAEFFERRSHACRMCGNCGKACPKRLPVPELMRVRMYHDEYGWPDHARQEFDSLGLDPAQLASACGDCRICTQVCPIGLAGAGTVGHVAGLFV